jgi:Leucine-rich repeat (LRR) protein
MEGSVGDVVALDQAEDAYIKALKRVTIAARTNAEELVLTGIPALTELPPLQYLERVETVVLRNTLISDLGPLRSLGRLKRVDLAWLPNVNLDSIPDWVEEITLTGANIADLSPLNRLRKLRSLKANNTKVADLSALDLTSLENLNVSRTKIDSIERISSFGCLQSLSINETGVVDLSPLSDLTSLMRLSCNQTKIASLSPIAALRKITNISCYRTHVSRLDPLVGMIDLRSLNIYGTTVSDLSPLSNLVNLQVLNAASAPIKDISPLLGLLQLKNLYLRHTRISEISSLSGLANLTSLDLSFTNVTDLSPLRGLSRIRKLDITSTPVRDLLALSEAYSLVEGAFASPKKAGLFFVGCPIRDAALRKMATEENPKRTEEVISYLRGQSGWESYKDPPSRKQDDDAFDDERGGLGDELEDVHLPLPPERVIPKQTSRALTFSAASEGPLSVLADPVAEIQDPEQNELYSRLRSQFLELLEQVPSQERVQITFAIEDFLRQPSSWSQVRYKKILWLCGNALRNILYQHDAVVNDPEPHYAKLPPALAEALRRPVETWNVVVLGDSVLLDLDARRVGPEDVERANEQLAMAEPIIAAAVVDRLITTSDAASAISAGLTAAIPAVGNIHARQAHEFARGTAQNLVVQIVRGAYRVVKDLQDVRSDEAKNFVKEYKSGIYKKMGEWTVTGAVAAVLSAATATYWYGVPFVEFVAANAPLLKAYLAIVFQSSPIVQVVDGIVSARARLLQDNE